MILKLSIILAIGFIGGRVAKLVKLPNVTGYLVMGLLLGVSFLNYITTSDLLAFDIINDLALSFIAFSIGSEFVVSNMLKYGKKIFIITLFQVTGAVLIVFFVIFTIFKQPFEVSLIIASMSAATAPAATLMVMRQYNAKGPLTRTVLPIVALDDILGIMIFGIALSVVKITTSVNKMSILDIIINPLIEIFGSLLLGFIIGVVFVIIVRKIKGDDDLQIISLVAIGIGVGLAELLNLSPLLTNIMIGATLVNLLDRSERIFRIVNNFVPAFYVYFFVLAGASLDLGILKTIGIMGVSYVFARGLGKIIGAQLGCLATKTEKNVTKYLGLCLLPQGGVSIGLSIIVRQQLPEFAPQITTIIMFGVLIYEISGPIFSKIALQKAGEINTT